MREVLLLNKEVSWLATKTHEREGRPKSSMTFLSDDEADGIRIYMVVEFDNETFGQDAIRDPFTKFKAKLYGIDQKGEGGQ